MQARHRKFALIAFAVVTVSIAATLVLNAFKSNLVFFFTPTQVANGEAPASRTFRIGGLVEVGSVKRQPDGLTAIFVVTDTARAIHVTYTGILPDLFKEGKGVVAEGRLGDDGRFTATQVLAKHDENYMPPEAADALAQAQKAQSTVAE